MAGISTLWLPSDTVEIASQFARRDLSLDRRQTLRVGTALAVGAALLELVEPWLMDDPKPQHSDAPRGVGQDEIEQLEKVALLFRLWDNQFGGGLKRRAVVGQLTEVADELRDHSHRSPLRTRLFAVLAQLAETAATMSWDTGDGPAAQGYYLIALRAAKRAGDRAFAANVLAAMARQLLYLGKTTDALELVRLAQSGMSNQDTSKVQAMLLTREAWAYAAQGRVTAFRRTTAAAQDALARTDNASEPAWIAYFDEAEVAGVTGGRLLDLAHAGHVRPTEAAEHIERALRLRPAPSLRSAALDHIGLAEARLVQGEPEEASRLGHQALDVVARTTSDRVRVKLVEFFHHAERHSSVAAVASLRNRIRELARDTKQLPEGLN